MKLWFTALKKSSSFNPWPADFQVAGGFQSKADSPFAGKPLSAPLEISRCDTPFLTGTMQPVRGQSLPPGFTPLEKAIDEVGGVIPYRADGGLKPPSALTVRERSSLMGFTLLELLIGITIFAIVAASVYTSLYLGIKVSKLEEKRNEGMQEAVVTLKEISKKLRCAYINPQNEKIKFKGSAEQVDFFSVNESGDVENIIFYLEPGGEENIFSLFRAKKKYTQLNEKNSGSAELVNRKVYKLKFSYFDGKKSEWCEDWLEELRLPQQVKLEINFGPESVDEEQLFNLVAYVNIPLANILDFNREEL